jgi:hypothetical protein
MSIIQNNGKKQPLKVFQVHFIVKQILVTIVLNDSLERNKLNYCSFLGFFSYQNKKYGIFLVCVQTFTRKIWATPIKNTKIPTLVTAFSALVKVE